MKKLIIVYFLMLTFSCSNLSLYQIPRVTKIKHNFLIFEDVGIKKSPLTNRDYIIFLCWNINVYGSSYPEKILTLLPLNRNNGKDEDIKNLLSRTKYINQYRRHEVDFQFMFERIDDATFQSYTLNPKYLDYPVVGLSEHQISELLKWLSDRYNECELISRGILNFNPEQRDEDCWVLESYVTGQYQGDVRKNLKDENSRGERAPVWSDLFFLPTFRLPFESELQRIKSNFEEPFKLKEYDFERKNFLKIWDKTFIEVKNNQLTLNLYQNQTVKILKSPNDFDVDELILKAGKLDNNCYKNLKYLEHQNNNEKDKFGHRDFLILGETPSHKAITGEFKEIENGNERKNLISWVVFNKVLEIDDLKE